LFPNVDFVPGRSRIYIIQLSVIIHVGYFPLAKATYCTQFVVVARKGDLRRVIATLWEKGSYGFAGRQVAERGILEAVESLGEGFANKYLAAQQKDK
jgi:hypothetical protein